MVSEFSWTLGVLLGDLKEAKAKTVHIQRSSCATPKLIPEAKILIRIVSSSIDTTICQHHDRPIGIPISKQHHGDQQQECR